MSLQDCEKGDTLVFLPDPRLELEEFRGLEGVKINDGSLRITKVTHLMGYVGETWTTGWPEYWFKVETTKPYDPTQQPFDEGDI
jgi:hypothetical protein